MKQIDLVIPKSGAVLNITLEEEVRDASLIKIDNEHIRVKPALKRTRTPKETVKPSEPSNLSITGFTSGEYTVRIGEVTTTGKLLRTTVISCLEEYGKIPDFLSSDERKQLEAIMNG